MAGSPVTNIPNHYRIKFGTSFDIALQDMSNEIRNAVAFEPGAGERVTLDRLDALEMTDYDSRGGDTQNTDWDSQITSIFPQPAEVSNKFDEWDEVYLDKISLPKSELSMSHAYAVNRRISKFIVDAFTGIRYRGKNGTTQTAFDTTNQRIAVDFGGSSEGMTFNKIAQAAYQMDEDEVPEEGRYIGFRAKQMQDLVDDILANHSTNLTDIRMMPGTKVITHILGFKVLQSQRFNLDAGTDIASAIAWQKDQVVLSLWSDRVTRMDILPTKRHALQVRTVVNGGAAVKDDLGVIEILCDESPAS